MRSYKDEVRLAALACDGRLLANDSIEHAKELAESLVRHASETVDVVTGQFNSSVYGTDEFVDIADGFLFNPGARMRVVIAGENENRAADISKEHKLSKELNKYDGLEFRHFPEDLQKHLLSNFMLVDDSCFRFENDKDVPKAVAAFQSTKHMNEHPDQVSTKLANQLSSAFDQIWSLSKPL